MNIQFEDIPSEMMTVGKKLSQAIANREMLDESKKSVLAKCATKYEGSESARERQARTDKEFKDYLEGVQASRQIMLELRYNLDALKSQFEYCRSMNSLRRAEANLT